MGFEPTTVCLQSRCTANCAISPVKLAGIVRFELTISESKSDALGQLGDIPTVLVDEVGLEPTTCSV